ncbi:MAG: hypothetical protein WEA34_07625 [Gemmatimonadota bacterium]
MSTPGPVPRSHFFPRTAAGRRATVAFLLLFALCMPPFTHTVWNRIEPTVGGLPFLWVVLLAIYTLLVLVLVRVYRNGI